ncbi:MAG: NAD-dependent deacylase [Rhizobiaceae bacterium]|nr:NAD-dependent deacylase [Rhizobiaceae bacterium]
MLPSSLVVLTGAGISAESGLSTFRDNGGIWSRVNIEDVAMPKAFAKDPQRVHAFYNQRRRDMADVQPNAAHFALEQLERHFQGDFLLVTQNIDDLHARAGSRNPIHMHGEIGKAFCDSCGERETCAGDLSPEDVCPHCGQIGLMRPDVVWFGEMPNHMEAIYEALANCDLFVAIGTSGTVYPAADFVRNAQAAGAHTIELNLQTGGWASPFAEQRRGLATQTVPALVAELLSGSYRPLADRH